MLRKAKAIEAWPFPHIVIEDALPDEIYRELKQTRPLVPGEGFNKRFDISASESLEMDLPDIWREFISYHCSKDFYEEVNSLFNLNLEGKVGVRCRDRCKIEMDCQISINTPGEGRVCIAHRDNPISRWSGLFYMGTDDAGLEIYDCPKPEWFGKRRVSNPGPAVKTIPFKDNIFIGFENVEHAIHAPESRDHAVQRHFVNFCIDQKP